jgi:hypothetical protein
MSAILTIIFRVTNWQALRSLSDQSLIVAARAAGATRYQIYRNVHDAAEALLIVECASHEAIRQLTRTMAQVNRGIAQLKLPIGDRRLDDQIWEPAKCLAIREEG